MAKSTKAATPKKKRANKYNEKLKLTGSFEDLVKELITPKKSAKNK
jgi:hypothetical protein